jgi:hypothetical protein
MLRHDGLVKVLDFFDAARNDERVSGSEPAALSPRRPPCAGAR